jgi:deoxyribodipyrimidine photo-lyase
MMTASHWPATQHAALENLAEFIPRAGKHYASNRNYDLGPTDRSNVSALSPWIRHRTLTEEQVRRNLFRKSSGGPIGRDGWNTDPLFGGRIWLI